MGLVKHLRNLFALTSSDNEIYPCGRNLYFLFPKKSLKLKGDWDKCCLIKSLVLHNTVSQKRLTYVSEKGSG